MQAMHEVMKNPPLAAIVAHLYLAILTPVFLVSSTNLMCDTLMLAFWVWALLLRVRGLGGEERAALLLAASLLVALCALTKYYGICLPAPLRLRYCPPTSTKCSWSRY